MKTMANPDNKAVNDKLRTRKNKNSESKREDDGKAPGQSSESGYPDGDYWDKGLREKSKEPPTESPEPDTGYRWES